MYLDKAEARKYIFGWKSLIHKIRMDWVVYRVLEKLICYRQVLLEAWLQHSFGLNTVE